jgi:hypothetical protein
MKQIHLRRYSLLVLLFVTVGSISCQKVFDPIEESFSERDASYFPYVEGAVWTYAVQGSNAWTVNISSDGNLYSGNDLIPPGSYDLKYNRAWTTVEWLCDGCGMDRGVPFLMVPASARYWEVEANMNTNWQYVMHGGAGASGTLAQSDETITVPAGVFDKCAVCNVIFYGLGSSGNVTYYLAPNVGIVKIVTASEVSELSSYHIPK